MAGVDGREVGLPPEQLPTVPNLGTLVPSVGTLLKALFPATREALLVTLYRDPDRRFYVRELIRIVELGQGTVQRELGNLAQAGIVTREASGGRAYYFANRRCPVFSELHGLIEKTAGYTIKLREALAELKGIRVAFVFGSMARAAAGPDSDIDLAVVGRVSFREVVSTIAPTRQVLGREVNPIVYSAAELRDRVLRGDHFAGELMSTDKQFVVGAQDDLDAVVGKQVAG